MPNVVICGIDPVNGTLVYNITFYLPTGNAHFLRANHFLTITMLANKKWNETQYTVYTSSELVYGICFNVDEHI